MSVDRRTLPERTAAATAALAWPSAPPSTRRADDLAPILTEIDKHHDEPVARLQDWIRQPPMAAVGDGPGVGKVLIGRGAVNQKGPEATFLAALHAIRAAGKKPPLNFVLVAEGEEEIGSPHFPQIVRRPEVQAALRRAAGIFMPSAAQASDGP